MGSGKRASVPSIDVQASKFSEGEKARHVGMLSGVCRKITFFIDVEYIRICLDSVATARYAPLLERHKAVMAYASGSVGEFKACCLTEYLHHWSQGH